MGNLKDIFYYTITLETDAEKDTNTIYNTLNDINDLLNDEK